MKCQTPDCDRNRATSATGTVFAHCDACTARLTAGAFGHSWHDRARTNSLPTCVVGGVPADAPQEAGREGSPRASASGFLRVARRAPRAA